MRKIREEAPTYLYGPWEYVEGKPRVSRCLVFEIALFCALYPVFAIIASALTLKQHLFTEPPSKI
jgi:hypothetical protein